MFKKLMHLSNEFDLVNQTVEYAKQFFINWKNEFPEEFKEYLIPYGLENELPEDFSRIKFEVFKIGYEIRTGQENLEALSVVLDLIVYCAGEMDGKLCSYYCYYDKNGKFIDDFIDR